MATEGTLEGTGVEQWMLKRGVLGEGLYPSNDRFLIPSRLVQGGLLLCDGTVDLESPLNRF